MSIGFKNLILFHYYTKLLHLKSSSLVLRQVLENIRTVNEVD